MYNIYNGPSRELCKGYAANFSYLPEMVKEISVLVLDEKGNITPSEMRIVSEGPTDCYYATISSRKEQIRGLYIPDLETGVFHPDRWFE